MSDPRNEFQEACASTYRQVVRERSDTVDGIERQDAFAFAAELIRERIHAGDLELPIDDAIHAELLRADRSEGAAGDVLVSELRDGLIGLDLWPDPRLDRVVVLGAGRRKPFRYVSADDVRAMHEIRRANTAAARRSMRRFKADMDSILPALIDAGSVGRMVEQQRDDRKRRTA